MPKGIATARALMMVMKPETLTPSGGFGHVPDPRHRQIPLWHPRSDCPCCGAARRWIQI